MIRSQKYIDNAVDYEVEKRVDVRVNFGIEIFYPIVNNKSVYKDYDLNFPLMTSINISESGICFRSRVPLQEGDFLSFMLQIDDFPSFWCLSEVKWAEEHDGIYFAGCRFYLLSEEYISLIKNYVKKDEKN